MLLVYTRGYILAITGSDDTPISMKRNFCSYFSFVSTTLLSIVIIFMISNGIVYYFFLSENKTENAREESSQYFYAADERGIEFLRKIYSSYSDRDIHLLQDHPGIVSHPSLPFMVRPVKSKFYNVGFENMRYNRYIHEGNAQEKINHSTWVFGGSTTFGHGVGDNETIPYYLNFLDLSTRYINFGILSANQNVQIEKLLLLLKKGYRPSRVIFINGFNEVTSNLRSRFHPAVTPPWFFMAFSLYQGFEFLNQQKLPKKTTWKEILEEFPLIQFFKKNILKNKKRERKNFKTEKGYEDIYNFQHPYHHDTKKYYDLNSPYLKGWSPEDPFVENKEDFRFYLKKIKEYYLLNYQFIDSLSKSFNFQYSIFLEPMGPLAKKNLFLKNGFETSIMYRSFFETHKAVQDLLKTQKLPFFFDISNTHDTCPDCYVDLVHYNSKLSKKIAQAIFAVKK